MELVEELPGTSPGAPQEAGFLSHSRDILGSEPHPETEAA